VRPSSFLFTLFFAILFSSFYLGTFHSGFGDMAITKNNQIEKRHFGFSTATGLQENFTNSTGTGLFEGKVNFDSLPTFNESVIKEKKRSFFDNVPGNITLFRELKKDAPFNKNATSNIIEIPPPTKNSNKSLILVPHTSSSINSNLGNSIANIKKINLDPLGDESNTRVSGFTALISNESCGGCTPPDVQIGVGQNHIVEAINNFISIWNKDTHTLEKNAKVTDFFRLRENDNTSDPYVLFDPITHRWLSSIMLIDRDVRNTGVKVAVSLTDNPHEDWNIFRFNMTDRRGNSVCPDRPIIGSSSDKLIISVNMVAPDSTGSCYTGGSASGTEIIVVNKDLLTDPRSQYFDTKLIHDDNRITFIPVKTREGSQIFLASTDWHNTNFVKLILLDGEGPRINFLCSLRHFTNQTSIPRDARQPFTDIKIDTSDNRILDSLLYRGDIWLAFNDGCKRAETNDTQSCFRLIQISITDASLFHSCNDRETRSGDGDIKSYLEIGDYQNRTDYYRPALEVNGVGDLFVVFGFSSENIYPSLGILKLSATGASPESRESILLKEGTRNTSAEFRLFEEDQRCLIFDPCTRYGDYFTAILDPTDPSVVWAAGQYYENITYSTFIGRISVTIR